MITRVTRSAVLRDWGHRCYYCAADLRRHRDGATLDHRLPRSRGGTDARSNLVPACRPCNQAKGPLTVEEFRRRVLEEQPAWRAMLALSALLASERSLASPSAFRMLWACAERAGRYVFPGEELEVSAQDGDFRGGRGAVSVAPGPAGAMRGSTRVPMAERRSVRHEELLVESRCGSLGRARLEPQSRSADLS